MIPIDSTLWKYSCRPGEMHDLMKTIVFLWKLRSPRNREGPWPPWRDAKNYGNINIFQKWILEYLLPFLVSGLPTFRAQDQDEFPGITRDHEGFPGIP